MCTPTALVDRLECYVEDVIECFEDFVKKTLLVVTVAAGAVVGMVMYVLRCSGRQQFPALRACAHTNTIVGTCSIPKVCHKRVSPIYSKVNTCKVPVKNCCSKSSLCSKASSTRNSMCCPTSMAKCPSVTFGQKKTLCAKPHMRAPSCERMSCRGSETSLCSKKSSVKPSPPRFVTPSCAVPTWVKNSLTSASCPPPPSCSKPSCTPPASSRSTLSCIKLSPCVKPSPCIKPSPCFLRPCALTRSSCNTTIKKITMPSLLNCITPKLVHPCLKSICDPKRCPSKPCTPVGKRNSCCSMCRKDD